MIRLRAAALVMLVPVLALAGCGSSSVSENTSVTCSYPDSGAPAAKAADTPPKHPPTDEPSALTISTSAGAIAVQLDAKNAPCTVNSFVSLAQQGYFDDVFCHRLLAQGAYVLQCGDPTATGEIGSGGSGGPGYSFADELLTKDPRLGPCSAAGCTYKAGTVAMANSGANTNGSQFFLVYGDSVFPPSYTIFGQMTAAGLGVVKAIGAAGVDPSSPGAPGEGPPATPVQIKSVK